MTHEVDAIRKRLRGSSFYEKFTYEDIAVLIEAIDKFNQDKDELNLQIAGLKASNVALERVAAKVAEENAELRKANKEIENEIECYSDTLANGRIA